MKITAEKLNKAIHDISNLATRILALEKKVNGKSKLGKKLKEIEIDLMDIRQEILLSINNKEN